MSPGELCAAGRAVIRGRDCETMARTDPKLGPLDGVDAGGAVRSELANHVPQMPFVLDNDVVESLAA